MRNNTRAGYQFDCLTGLSDLSSGKQYAEI